MTSGAVAGLIALALALPAGPLAAQTPETIVVDVSAPAQPFAHFWEHMFGSGRAVLSLRESYREDLRAVRAATAVSYVRFHAVLHDEMGVYGVGRHGEALYNFSYIDQAYDGLLANGVRPLVELSFMPTKLAARQIHQSFWYRPIVSPPADYARWDALITALARHLIERYGIEEVSQWYFEVWNEPNLDFWAGEPKQSTYFTLYDHTARSLKAVDQRLRVGGPATAQAAWVPDFLRHCSEAHVPVDFVSTHVYGDDTAKDVFRTQEHISRRDMVCRAVQKVHGEIQASPLPAVPLIWTEFNASWSNHPEVTDAPFMGPWLAETIRQCDGLVQDMSYWTFSDVFEEQGVVKTPLYGGFGLIAAGGIPKPAFNAFALLHGLGEQRLASDAAQTLITRRADGALVLALWNYAEPRETVPPRKVALRFTQGGARSAGVQSIDREHGNVHIAYERMGSPPNPTQRELVQLREAAALPRAVDRPLQDGELDLEIPSDGLVLVTLPPAR
ncbi:MAG: glycosyl hydrolase family 39 [Gammaproteobacteria bacterium]|nr:glycosyl hydrolase family 39 [Gammaproteobacteria bacterium]